MANEKLKVNRTLGFELEGFVMDDCSIGDSVSRYADVGYDGSLCYGDGDAVEIRTEPINDLNIIEEIYEDLTRENWNVNDTCGLHIHVDTSDFRVKDQAKLLRFGAGMELLMYALVDKERYYGRGGDAENGGGYCKKLHHSWRKIFKQELIGEQPIPYDTFDYLDELCDYVNSSTEISNRCWNGKYQWLNANVQHYPTVEFRIFNATDDYLLVQKFGMLAYHMVETVKNSTVKQLSFIIKSVYESSSLDEMYEKFFNAIGLDYDFRPTVRNGQLADYIFNKYCTGEVATGEQAV